MEKPSQSRRMKQSGDSLSITLPNPYVPGQTTRGKQSGQSPKMTRREVGDVKSQSFNGRLSVGEHRDDFLQRNRSTPKATKSNREQRAVARNTTGTQKTGSGVARTAGTSKPALDNWVPFEVKMSDFPKLSGVPVSCAPTAPIVDQKEYSWMSLRRSQTLPDKSPDASMTNPPEVLPAHTVVTSWANVASQPPKKPVPLEKTHEENQEHCQKEDTTVNATAGKKKRRKKKKKNKTADDEENEDESEEAVIQQEPPKFEDEEEFPGLGPVVQRSTAAKVCTENHMAGKQHEESKASISVETVKKAQKTEKVSGKKSKVPVQLDIGNMLEALEKKQQQSQKDKPVVLSVGGGLPVVHKAPMAQKKPEKFAHNPLDSTSPLVKKGKQREVPKPKKPTALKKVILKEREERKQRRLMEERGETAEEPEDAGGEEGEQRVTNNTEECPSPTGEPEEQPVVQVPNLSQEEENGSYSSNKVKIHSRRFRDYCSQMLSRDVDECVTTLLKELVRFQDRLYQKDPMKARMKRRIVMGLREVLKHLKLRKLKCVIISPNCERSQSKGGLDEALHSIIDTCREQEVPFVFALTRKTLGRCVNKAVAVSVVGIFNYDGAQDFYHQMITLSSEARTAYEVMLSSLEAEMEDSPRTRETELVVGDQTEEFELQIKSHDEEEGLRPNIPSLEEPEYMKLWREMMKNHRETMRSSILDQNGEQETEVEEEKS